MPSYEYIWADTDRNRITIVEEHNPQRDIFQNIFGRYLSFYLREAMSHAQTSRMETDGSSLTSSRHTDRMHTANAATVREHEVLMNLSAWLIEAQAFVIVTRSQQQISGRSIKWAMEIREYVSAVREAESPDYNPEWVDWALKKADWYDPVIAREDELLGTTVDLKKEKQNYRSYWNG